MTSPLSVSCTAIFNGLMISGQPGRHRIGTIGVTKLVKYYTCCFSTCLHVVCIDYNLLFKITWLFTNSIHYCKQETDGSVRLRKCFIAFFLSR